MLETITAIAIAVGKIFGFGEKAIQPDVIRIDNHEIKKPRLEQRQLISIYDNQYRRLANHPEIDIARDTDFICSNIADDQRASMITDLVDRIFQYRSRHKILFRKFLGTTEFQEWQKKQNSK